MQSKRKRKALKGSSKPTAKRRGSCNTNSKRAKRETVEEEETTGCSFLQQQSMMGWFAEFPYEVIELMLLSMDSSEVFALRVTCKQFYAIGCSNAVWRHLVHKSFFELSSFEKEDNCCPLKEEGKKLRLDLCGEKLLERFPIKNKPGISWAKVYNLLTPATDQRLRTNACKEPRITFGMRMLRSNVCKFSLPFPKPKYSRTGYQFYSMDMRPKPKERYPDKGGYFITKQIAEEWKKDPSLKSQYEPLAVMDLRR